MDYWKADEAKEIAEKEVIPQWHENLSQLRIAYLFVDDLVSKGKTIAAKIKKASSLEHFLTDYNLILTVNKTVWKRFGPAKRLALIDHEFCHVMAGMDKRGKIWFTLVGHDLEEFSAVVKRHGIWDDAIADFQMALPLDNQKIREAKQGLLDSIPVDGSLTIKSGKESYTIKNPQGH